jgi:chemotaxis protein MotB
MSKSNSFFYKLFLTASFAGVFTTGCVTQKAHDVALAEKRELSQELGAAQEELAVANKAQERLKKQSDELQAEKEATKEALKNAQADLNRLKKEYEELKNIYEGVQTSSGEMSKNLAAKQQRLLAMEERLELSKQQNDELAADLEVREARVRELERVLDEKDKAVNALKNKVSQALLGFKEKDLSVEMKNGKVYVSLNEQLLFGSGSITVDQKGVEALKQLAKVLKDQPDINVLVEGHTDNVGISRPSKYMQDNWDLSVIRATSISRILIEAGVNPSSITAAGKGEHMPLTSNETDEGRSQNRRTEIILTPKLDELFQILQ